MSKRKKSTTEQMIEAVSGTRQDTHPNLPAVFLCGLRGALDAGLSCEQITAFLVLFTGIYEAADRMPGEVLIERSRFLVDAMRGDIADVNDQGRQLERNRKYQEERERQRLAKRKMRIGV